MQPSSPKSSQPEPENKCPDCLYIKLEGIPVQTDNHEYQDVGWASTQTPQIDLHLTIKFNEQWQPLKGGRIKFGLKGGELRLKLENSEIPTESRYLVGAIELVEQDQQELQGNTDKKHLASRRPFNFIVNGNQPKELKSPVIQQDPIGFCHVTTKVSEENPAWVFEAEISKQVLKGSLHQAKLATLNITALPCRVEATFEISKLDLCLTYAEGLWSSDISRNKKAVLERLIIQRLLEPKFKPYLSKAELHYD
ncbi:MAG: hypothetical protein WA828_20460 [Coleofasciculaceae cyanobacterium]